MNTIHFLMTWRHFKNNWFYISANIVSLAIAFSVMVIAFFNLNFNQNFNHFFASGQKVYKINPMLQIGDDLHENSRTPAALAENLNSNEGLIAGRFQYGEVGVRKDVELISQTVGYVDPSFLDLVSIPLSTGEKAHLVKNERSVLLSQELSTKLFGFSNPVGRELELVIGESRKTYLVTGVISSLPENISFHFDLLLPFQIYLDTQSANVSDWSLWVDATFVGGSTEREIERSLKSLLSIQNKYNQDKLATNYAIHSLWSWPAKVNYIRANVFQGVLHPASVIGTVSSAFFVLLLACVNFINTNLTLVGKRIKEVALKKTLGANRRQFGWQLLSENAFYLLLALSLAIGISYVLFPEYNAMFPFEIVDFHWENLSSLVAFLSLVVLLVLSIVVLVPLQQVHKVSTVSIFRGAWKQSARKYLPLLLVLQFTISTYNLFSLLVFAENDRYQQNLDNGFQVGNIVNLPVTSEADYTKLLSVLGTMPEVEQINHTTDLVGFGYQNQELVFDGFPRSVATLNLGAKYAKQIGIKLAGGRFFREVERKKVILINELMANQMGEKPLGKRVKYKGEYYEIIGITEDFNLRSIMLNNKRQPVVIFPSVSELARYCTVAFRRGTRGDQETTIRNVWNATFSDRLYTGFFQEDAILPLKETNHIILRINTFVAIATLVMSLVGFYSAIALAVQRKYKELGVRKVLGADFWQVAYHLNKPFMHVLWIAALLGLTGGYFFIDNLLDIIYAYHINISVKHFLGPVALVLAMVSASSGLKLIGAIKENPVHHLRIE